MATVFMPAKHPVRTSASGFGGVSTSSIFMPSVFSKPVKRGMGADAASIMAAATHRPLMGLGAGTVTLLNANKFSVVQPSSSASSGDTTTTWVLVGVGLLVAVGGLVYVSTRGRK